MRTDHTPSRASHRCRAGRPGFSLVELLVVAGILVLLLLFAAGAISSLYYSSERSLAENQLRVGLTAARDLAVRSEGGDAGALFIFEDGRASIVPVIQVGTLRQDNIVGVSGVILGGAGGPKVDRDVFVPAPGTEPTVMPRGWSIRGFAPPGSIRDGWYNDTTQTAFAFDPATPATVPAGTWVFPENWFYDDEFATGAPLAQQGWKRQSFFIRYESQTGNLAASGTGTCLVLSPSQNDAFRSLAAFVSLPLPNDASNLESYARTALQLPPAQAIAAIGNLSSDSILVRSVTEIALTDENRLLASMTGVQPRGLNRNTNSFYVWADTALVPGVAIDYGPSFDPRLFTGAATTATIQDSINKAIVPDLAIANQPGPFESRIFTVQRYLGQVQEFTP
jgi:prepilin-type N-terminal cleavage/methylation domain-containing protein